MGIIGPEVYGPWAASTLPRREVNLNFKWVKWVKNQLYSIYKNVIITWAGQYCLVKCGQCILCDKGSALEILGPGGQHIRNFGSMWAVDWEYWAHAVCITPNIGPASNNVNMPPPALCNGQICRPHATLCCHRVALCCYSFWVQILLIKKWKGKKERKRRIA